MGMINQTHIVHDLTMSVINDLLAKGHLTNDASTLAKAYDEISRNFVAIFNS